VRSSELLQLKFIKYYSVIVHSTSTRLPLLSGMSIVDNSDQLGQLDLQRSPDMLNWLTYG